MLTGERRRAVPPTGVLRCVVAGGRPAPARRRAAARDRRRARSSLRITEVEAYVGDGVDPGSHAFRGRTKRNARHVRAARAPVHVLHLRDARLRQRRLLAGGRGDGRAAARRRGRRGWRALRGGRARRRGAGRSGPCRDRDLARGPARLVVAAGIRLDDERRRPASRRRSRLQLPQHPARRTPRGPRTGCRGAGGGVAFPWRYWLPGDPTVSPYKRHPKSDDRRGLGAVRPTGGSGDGEPEDARAHARPDEADQRADDEPLARLGRFEFGEPADALDRDRARRCASGKPAMIAPAVAKRSR